MMLPDNPILLRELRRMQPWRGRCGPALSLAMPIALAGLAMPLLAAGGVWPAAALWSRGAQLALAIYVLSTPVVAVTVIWAWQRDAATGVLEQLRLTPLSRGEMEAGRIWSVTLPLIATAAVGALGHLSLLAIPGAWDSALHRPQPGVAVFVHMLGWLLFVAHVHFTALLAIGGLSDIRTMTWASVGVTVLCSIGLDLVAIGLVLKPVFLIMQVVDRSAVKVLGSPRPHPPLPTDELP